MKQKSDFEYIFSEDETCTYWWCGKPGVVLAYDTFSPEIAHWFCQSCWDAYLDDDMLFLTVIDHREDESIPTKVDERL